MTDWPTIKLMYQQGHTCYAISQRFGGKPTRQGIRKRSRREGWDEAVTGELTSRHLVTDVVHLGADTPDTRKQILEMLARGATFRLAAEAAGISPKTLERWRKRDLRFGLNCRAVRHQSLVKHIANIDRAGDRDWKASKYILAVAPETRDQFTESKHSGDEIIVLINIDRDAGSNKGLVIDQDTD